MAKLFNAIKQLHELLASPIAAKQLETPIVNQSVLVGGPMLT
jgi:hypothetical protein